MRYLIVLLVLANAAVAFSQTAGNPAMNQIRHLLKEKIRLKDIPAAIEWHKKHPGYIGTEQAAPDVQPAGGRSSEIVVHDDNKAESEVHAAMNPADTNNIIAAAILQDPNNVISPIKVTVYYSKNFGQTWLASSIVFSPNTGDGLVAGGGDPVIAFDKSGNAYIAWLVLNIDLFGSQTVKLALYYSSSSNQGQIWSAPALIDFGTVTLDVLQGGNGAGALVDKEWLAADQSNSLYEGNLYVSYTRFDILDTNTIISRILVKTKPKNNGNFGGGVQVHQGTYSTIQFSSIDVDGQGNVHVLFFAGNSDDDLALYHAVSDNGGASFQPEVKVSDVHFPGVGAEALNPIDGVAPDRLYPCPHLCAGKTPGALYAAWCADGLSEQETEGYDVWFSKSTDNGLNWQQPVRINPGDNPLAEQFYPALSVSPSGTICISYYDRTNDPEGTETNYVVAYSFDEGVTFTPPVNASLAPSDFSDIGLLNDNFGVGEYTQVVCTDYNAIPVWSDGRSNNGDIDIYAAILPLGGDVSATGETGTITDAFSVRAPNPARGHIDLEISLEKSSGVQIQVFTTDGKMIFSENKGESLAAGTYSSSIPVPPGIYLCRVQTRFGFKIRRIAAE